MRPFYIIKEMLRAEDAWIFPALGFGIALLFGFVLYRQKIRLIRACISLGVYAVCELLADIGAAKGISGTYWCFAVGLIALGSALGFGAAALLGKLTGKKDRLFKQEET